MQANNETIARLWDLAKSIETAMLNTHSAQGIHARPIAPILEPESNRIWIVTARKSAKVGEILKTDAAVLTFSGTSMGSHVVMNGSIHLHDDRAKLAELWTVADDLFFPNGPTDPDAVLLLFEPAAAEYWTDRGNSFSYAFEVIRARLKGEVADISEHRKLSL